MTRNGGMFRDFFEIRVSSFDIDVHSIQRPYRDAIRFAVVSRDLASNS